MELPKEFIPLTITVIIVAATIFIPLLVQQLRNRDAPETGPATHIPSTHKEQLSTQDAVDISTTYRLRCVPSELDKQGVKELVERVLRLEDHIAVVVRSLTDDPSQEGEKVATVAFSKIPWRLSREGGRTEWRFPIHNGQLEGHNLLFDTHFRGLTPLHSRSDSKCIIE